MALVEPGTLVLVVDDDVEVRLGISDVLGMEGYDARPLSSADSAWSEIARGADPALVILDLWLPGMSSGEFVRRLRASRARSVPVLVLSGERTAKDVEADVDAVLQKPMEAPSLVRAVDKLVARRARRSARSRATRHPGTAVVPARLRAAAK